MMGNSDNINKTQENFISNNYYHQIKTFSQTKDSTKKIKCKEKPFINFFSSTNHEFQSSFSNYNYPKTTKIKNNITFSNNPNPTEEIIFKNIYNNRDLINDHNNSCNNIEEQNKEKKFMNVKNKTKNTYQSYTNLKSFFRKDENIKNNNFHMIKSEKKITNLKQNYNTTKPIEKSKDISNATNFNNINENNKHENIRNKIFNEIPFFKTENNFHNKKVKNQAKNMKSFINMKKDNQISKLNIDYSNKSTKIKNVFVKNKTEKNIRLVNLKFENLNKKKEDCLYIKSNNKIIINNNKIINKDSRNNNVINYIYNSNKTNINYKISNQNKKTNIFNNNIQQNKLYNFENNYTPTKNILFNITQKKETKLNKENPDIKVCNNQIIYNDNKNIFIQNNYIDGKLNATNEITQIDNSKKKIYIKNKTFDNIKQNKQNNYIINLKSFVPNKEDIKNTLNNFKDIIFGNNNIINKDEEKNKKEINENNNEDKSTIVDDSIILNSSDVYGTLNFSKSFNNLNNSVKKEENKSPIKDEYKNKEDDDNNNEDNTIDNVYINPYSNYRETITMNMNYDTRKNNINKKEKEDKKISISDITKNNIKSHKKENIKEYISINSIKNTQKNNEYIYKNIIKKDIDSYKNFSVVSIPGKNFGATKTNQDTPVAFVNINDIKGFNLFGVLDGHGTNGHYVSKFLRRYLFKSISKNPNILSCKNIEQIYKVIKNDNYEILINIFLKADEALSKQAFDVSFSGTTCVLVIQLGQKIICANVGDSRAILVYNNNTKNEPKNSIFNLSHDFKPDLLEEKKRIYKMGGTVEQMVDINGIKAGPPRVWGIGKNYPGLAMSRSLGDFKGKKYGIISLPEIIETNLNENTKYIVICSDGVWEFLSNENVMEIGNKFYEKNDVNGFTKKLVETAEGLWEQKDVIVDDITAVVVFY